MTSYKNNTQPLLIGIAGGPGAGKHTIAHSIVDGHSDVSIVSMEWFCDSEAPAEPKSYNIRRLVDMLALMKDKRNIGNVLKIVTCGKEHEVKCTPAVIVIGTYAFYSPQLSHMMDIKIFVECDADIRLCRLIRQLDMKTTESLHTFLSRYEHTIAPNFDKWVVKQRPIADIIVNNNEGANVSIIGSVLRSAVDNMSIILAWPTNKSSTTAIFDVKHHP